MSEKFFRKPKDGEWIQYDCGCIYEIVKVKGHALFVEAELFCEKHDPTLTEYAREHADEIGSAYE